jgi:Ulp1 family protease
MAYGGRALYSSIQGRQGRMWNPHLPGTRLHEVYEAEQYGQGQDPIWDVSDSPPATLPEDKPWCYIDKDSNPGEYIITLRDKELIDQNGAWLNDNIINAFIETCLMINMGRLVNIEEYSLSKSVTALDTFTYTKMHTPTSSVYTNITKFRTIPKKSNFKKYDIFLFDKVIIPINFPGHWATVVVDFLKKEIRLYDSSLNSTLPEAKKAMFHTIKKYITACQAIKVPSDKVANYKHLDISAPGLTEVIDRDFVVQDDGSSCGVFTCIAIKRLLLGGSLKSKEKDPKKGISAGHSYAYRREILHMFEMHGRFEDHGDRGSSLFRSGTYLQMLMS